MVPRLGLLTVLVLLALASFNVASAAAKPLQVNCILNGGAATDIGTCITESVGISVLALVLSLSIVALAYMISNIVHVAELQGWYRKELWETTKSAMIVAIVYAVIVLLGTLGASIAGSSALTGTSLLGGSYATMPDADALIPYCQNFATFSVGEAGIASNLASLYNTAIIGYLQPTLCNANNAFAAIFGLSIGLRAAHTLELNTWFPVPLGICPWCIGSIQFGSRSSIFVGSFLESILMMPTFSFISGMIRVLVVPIMITLQVQAELLPIAVASALGVLLPIGIIMRAVPFLRGIGGTMIAVAIGVAIIYPALLVAVNLPITDYFVGLTANSPMAPSGCGGGVACLILTWFNPITDLTTQMPLIIALGPHYDPSIATDAVFIGFWEYTVGLRSIFPALNMVVKHALLMVVQVILVALDIIVGVTLVQAIARSLGGELRLGIGKRMKLA